MNEFQYSTTTCETIDASTTNCYTKTDGVPYTLNGFTQGEMVISFFLTIFMMAGIFTFIINHFVYQKK